MIALAKLSPDRLAFKLALLRASGRRRPVPSAAAPRSILVGATTFLGDMLMMAPMVAALCRHYPGARITLLVRQGQGGLAACIMGVDEVLEERASFRWLRSELRRTKGYDLAVVALESRILPLVAALGARTIIAYPDPKGRHSRLVDRPLLFPSDAAQPLHQTPLLLRLVDAETESFSPPYLDLSHLPPFESVPATPFVVIHPGARAAVRRWPPERYSLVAAACIAQGYDVVLTGTADDLPAIETIMRPLDRKKAQTLAGKTSLTQMAQLIGKASLVIGPDTGILHLAKALGRPAVIIMGQGQLDLFGPDSTWGPAEYLYVPDLPCRDKHTLHGQYAPWINTCTRSACILPEPRCLLEITHEQVIERAQRMLAASHDKEPTTP